MFKITSFLPQREWIIYYASSETVLACVYLIYKLIFLELNSRFLDDDSFYRKEKYGLGFAFKKYLEAIRKHSIRIRMKYFVYFLSFFFFFYFVNLTTHCVRCTYLKKYSFLPLRCLIHF